MGTDIAEKLTAEIENCRKFRHELVMRKFTFLVAFAGLGSIENIPLPNTLPVSQLIYLLYLVPFIAVAFDIYIFVEDYRIKRAGEFLKRLSGLEDHWHDAIWQSFVAANPNKGSTFAFLFVTGIFVLTSFMLLIHVGEPAYQVIPLFLLAALAEVGVFLCHLRLRNRLEECKFCVLEKMKAADQECTHTSSRTDSQKK
jgi:hypothetical protein